VTVPVFTPVSGTKADPSAVRIIGNASLFRVSAKVVVFQTIGWGQGTALVVHVTI